MSKKQFVVIGLGRFGSSIATTLYSLGNDVLVIDKNEDLIQDIASEVTHAVQADATDENALKSLGIRNFDVAIISIGGDIQSSVMATLILRELGVKYIIAKGNGELHAKVLYKIGADRVVLPEKDMGVRVAHNIISSSILDYIELSSDYSIMEVKAFEDWVGKDLKSLDLRKKYGINVIYGKNIYSNTLGYGATPREKANDLNEAFANSNVQAIFCAKGGENSNTIFEYIDYELIKQNPKIFSGFSDSTFLLNMIYEKTGLTTFHGSTFKAISDWDAPCVFNDIIDKMMNEKLSLNMNPKSFKVIKQGEAKGALIGGNLSCIREMVCGKYSIDFKDKILFIEDLGEESNPKFESNFLYYMKQNGVFNQIKGLWIGNYEHESQIKLENIVLDVLENNYNFPIIKSENFGHIAEKQVIPIGVKSRIDTANEEKIILMEKCVK